MSVIARLGLTPCQIHEFCANVQFSFCSNIGVKRSNLVEETT
jgi:hypothetical protein